MPGNEETTKADLGQGEKPEIPAGKGFVGLEQTEECQGERGSCALRGLGGDGGGSQRMEGDGVGSQRMEGDGGGSQRMEGDGEEAQRGFGGCGTGGMEGLEWESLSGDPWGQWRSRRGGYLRRTEGLGAGIPEWGSLRTEGLERGSLSGDSWRGRGSRGISEQGSLRSESLQENSCG